MKGNWLRLVMVAFLAISGGQVFGADESENQTNMAEVRVDFLSAYVWRGITLNDGFVVQPALDLLHPSGLGFNVWGNVDIDDYNGRYEKGEISEVDLAVRYELPLEGPLALAVAYAEYLYPKEGKYMVDDPTQETVEDQDTREVSVHLSLTPIESLSLDLGIYRDVDESNGWYGDAGVSYTYEITEAFTLNGSVRLGIADKKFAEYNVEGTKGGFFDWNATLAAEYEIADGLSLGASVSYVDNIDDDVFPEDSCKVNVLGGVNVLWSF